MITRIENKKSTARVQANVDADVKETAERVIKEVGLTPTAVINGLYHRIAATGTIPYDFSLTPDQLADLKLKNAVQDLPVKKLRTKKDIEEFFDDED